MYLTVCPLHGPGYDSSVGEQINLTVCPLHGPGYDSSVGERMNLTVCPPCGPGSIPMQPWRSLPRSFSLTDRTPPTRPESAWQKMAQSPLNGTTQPVDSEEDGQSPTTYRQWPK